MLPSFPGAKMLGDYGDHIEIFKSRAVVEIWAPPDCVVRLKFTSR